MSIESHAAKAKERATRLTSISRFSGELSSAGTAELTALLKPATGWKFWTAPSADKKIAAVIVLGDRAESLSAERAEVVDALVSFLMTNHEDDMAFSGAIKALGTLAPNLTLDQRATVGPRCAETVSLLKNGLDTLRAAEILKLIGLLKPSLGADSLGRMAAFVAAESQDQLGGPIKVWGSFALAGAGHEVSAQLLRMRELLERDPMKTAIEKATNLPLQAGDALDDLLIATIPRFESPMTDHEALESKVKFGLIKRNSMLIMVENMGVPHWQAEPIVRSNELVRKQVAIQVAEHVMVDKVSVAIAAAALGPAAASLAPDLESLLASGPPEPLRGALRRSLATLRPATTTADSPAVASLRECKWCKKAVLGQESFLQACRDAGLGVDAQGRVTLPVGGMVGSHAEIERTIEARRASLQAIHDELESQKGFQCTACAYTYCTDCVMAHAPAHVNGGKACPKCRGRFRYLAG